MLRTVDNGLKRQRSASRSGQITKNIVRTRILVHASHVTRPVRHMPSGTIFLPHQKRGALRNSVRQRAHAEVCCFGGAEKAVGRGLSIGQESEETDPFGPS